MAITSGLGNSKSFRTSVCQRRKVGPVFVFAALGVFAAIATIYLWGSWVMSPSFGPTPIGADLPPLRVVVTIRTLETLSVALWCWAIYYFVIREWRRTGGLTSTGMFVLAAITLYVEDPLENYSSYFFLYNSVFVNFGAWVMHVPGWMTPRGNLIPEAVLCWGGAYIWWALLPSALAAQVMRAAHQSFRRVGNLELFLIAFICLCLWDFIMEATFVRTSAFAFGSVIPELSIWAGKRYQFPLYEAFLNGFYWMGLTTLFYFKDDKGLTYVERGSENLRFGGAKGKKILRFFAILGVLHLNYNITYNIPMQWFGTHGNAFPENYPSYLLAGVCGKGTPYACPGPDVAIARGQHSKALSPLTGNK